VREDETAWDCLDRENDSDFFIIGGSEDLRYGRLKS
jgi:hypothetical protein